MISVSGICVQFGGEEILQDISFQVNDKDCVGLVGKNGAGKSTLLKIIAGLNESMKGSVASPTGTTTGYLPQDKIFTGGQSIYLEAREAFKEELKLKEKISRLEKEMLVGEDHESEAYLKIIQDYNEANDRFHLIGGANIEENIERVLMGLGFMREDFTRNIMEFSGGWRMRVELAKLLLQKPDVLLLDEPTNHLDIESIQWLENYLAAYTGAVILVSHDRALLDNICKRTIEISLGKIYDYPYAYTRYTELRKERMEQQMASYINQQKQIEETEKFIERFRYKATKANQVQSRIKQLDKIERVEVDEEDKSAIHIKFPAAPKSGKIVIEAEDISKSYGSNNVLKKIDFVINAGEKIAFVGKNGEGKTTMARIILNELEHEGKLTIGFNVSVGYYAQNQADLLNPEKTVLETIDDLAVGDIRTKIRDILGAFLFRNDDVFKKVKVLSGGEKSRLALATLLLKPVNLLVLDEPTNHLDMRSKEILKQALKQYKGTLLVVSHDRDFLEGLTNKVFEFKNKQIKQFIGTVKEYMQSRRLQELKELEKGNKIQKDNPKVIVATDKKTSYEERKQKEKEARKIQNAIKKLEEDIEQTEIKIKFLDDFFTVCDAPDTADYITKFEEYEKLKKHLAKLMEEWERMHLEE